MTVVCVLILIDTKAFYFVKQHSLLTKRWARLPVKILRIENKGSESITNHPLCFLLPSGDTPQDSQTPVNLLTPSRRAPASPLALLYLENILLHFFILCLSACFSDADRPAALRSGDREASELHPEHGRPLHHLDLCRGSPPAGKLPGITTTFIHSQQICIF